MDSAGINWNTLLGALGPSGILIWYLWYTQTRTLPDKDKAHSAERQDERAKHSLQIESLAARYHASLDRIVDGFRADLKEERIARAEEIQALREGFHCSGRPGP